MDRVELSESTRREGGGSRQASDPAGIRTPVAAVKGRCPRPLDDGAAARDAEASMASGIRLSAPEVVKWRKTAGGGKNSQLGSSGMADDSPGTALRLMAS